MQGPYADMSNVAQPRFGLQRSLRNTPARRFPMSTHSEEWRSLAEKASKEMNPKKLLRLLKQLSFALDDEKPLPARGAEDGPQQRDRQHS